MWLYMYMGVVRGYGRGCIYMGVVRGYGCGCIFMGVVMGMGVVVYIYGRG